MVPGFDVLSFGDPLRGDGLRMMQDLVANPAFVQAIDELLWNFHERLRCKTSGDHTIFAMKRSEKKWRAMTAPRSCEPLRKSGVPLASEYSGTFGHCTFLRQLHRAFEFWLLRFKTEVVGIQIVNPGYVLARQWRAIGRFREFNELGLLVNVGQSGRDPIVCKQPLQRRLPKCALGIFKKT